MVNKTVYLNRHYETSSKSNDESASEKNVVSNYTIENSFFSFKTLSDHFKAKQSYY